jgi:hypothetical protein
MRTGRLQAPLEKQFGGDVEALAQALDVILVHFAFSAQDFRDNARSAEHVDEVSAGDGAGP